MSILIGILGLGFLVLIHEAGHFYTARAVGMKPKRFYVGFPPALVKRKRKGIEYGIGAIPLGGYVKIPGMHRPAPEDLDASFGQAMLHDPSLVGPVERLKRLVADGNFTEARRALGDLDEELARAQLPPVAARAARRGREELADALGPEAYWRAPTWKRVLVIAAGPLANILFAILLLALVYMLGIPNGASRRVEKVSPKSPAAHAGLRAGDEIVAVNLQPTKTFKDVSKAIRASKGKPIIVSVRRPPGRYLELPPEKTIKQNGYYIYGFEPAGIVYKRYDPATAVGYAAKDTWDVTKGIATSLASIVRGPGRKDVSSPVGIVDVSSQAVKTDYRDYLEILALISLSLALLNLLPLLPLDGGHIAFSLIEGIRGRSVGRVVYERVSALGIALVLLLFFVGLSNDIGRIGGG
ncbi:MAG TPA: site-2 protease family protein [Gaiellaceae bacterium]|nr:site-2 protease family protein [Gaiellaceae bacterium]